MDQDNEGPAVGMTAHVTLTVTEADTALALGSGDVPVLGTPRVVALMEQAACAAIAGTLASDRTTVGTHIDIKHLAPSFVGAEVEATANLTVVDGKLLHFQVEATMGADVVATGDHLRAVVRRAGFGG